MPSNMFAMPIALARTQSGPTPVDGAWAANPEIRVHLLSRHFLGQRICHPPLLAQLMEMGRHVQHIRQGPCRILLLATPAPLDWYVGPGPDEPT